MEDLGVDGLPSCDMNHLGDGGTVYGDGSTGISGRRNKFGKEI